MTTLTQKAAPPLGRPALEANERCPETVLELTGSVVDRDLAERISRALCATGYPPLRLVELEVRNLGVTLRGHVPSYHMKQIAQSVVMAIPGIREFHNAVDVSSP
jgi:osmotically-inducible protein OsmY